jgi:hypothetical protein
MKIKLGGTTGIKLMIFQYEPVEIVSTLEIEKEFEDEDEAQKWILSQTDTINKNLEKDLENKTKLIVKKQSELKKKLKDLI